MTCTCKYQHRWVPLAIFDLKAFPQRKLWLADLMVQLVRAWRSSLCQPPTPAQSLICPTAVGTPTQCPSCPEDDWWSVVVMTMVLNLSLTPAFHGSQATRAGHTSILCGIVLIFFFRNHHHLKKQGSKTFPCCLVATFPTWHYHPPRWLR